MRKTVKKIAILLFAHFIKNGNAGLYNYICIGK
jgi:hypothetical protein